MLVQTDPKWEDVQIAKGVTIGKEGCLLICVCSANEILGNPVSPNLLATQLLEAGGFGPTGDLLWGKLRETSSCLWLYTGNGDPPIPNLKVIEYKSPQGSHFVLEYGWREYDPKPGTARLGIKSVRQLALIEQKVKVA